MQKDDGVLGTNELFQLTFTNHFTSEAARKRHMEKQGVCHTVALPFTLKKYL
jgi:hypothetical protein